MLMSLLKTPVLHGTMPILFLSAKTRDVDKAEGLANGGDDYLIKPFSALELTSRVKALLRRSQRTASPAPGMLTFGDICMDTARHTVAVNGQPVELSYKEYELLRLFLEQPGTVQSREAILRRVWDTDFIGESRTIDMHVRTLRQKLGEAGAVIQTVRKVGYKLEQP